MINLIVCDIWNVGSSASRGSQVYVGVDVSSGELVAISDWQLPSSTEHSTQPECQTQTRVFFIVIVSLVVVLL